MSRPERRAARAARRAKQRAERSRLSKEAAADRAKEEARAEERVDVFEKIRPIWEAWRKTAEGNTKTPCLLHEFVILWGSHRGWSFDQIQEHIYLANKFVDLHVSASAGEARNRAAALEKLTPEQRIMAKFGAESGVGN